MLPAPLGTVPGQAQAHACAEGTRVSPGGECRVDSSAISAHSDHCIHEMVRARQTNTEAHTGFWGRPNVDVNPRPGTEPSICIRQNSQLGESLHPVSPPSAAGKTPGTQRFISKIIYKRPFASVFLAGFQLLSKEHRDQRSFHQDAGTSSKGRQGRLGGMGFRGPRPLLVQGSKEV